MKKTNKKGFTIVELVIVIAVIAILSAVLIPTFSGVVNSSKEAAAKSNARNEYFAYVQALKGDVVATDSDFIYADENGKFVVIKDGVVDETVYDSLLDAEKVLLGLDATPTDAAYTETAVTVDSTTFNLSKVTAAA